MKELIERLYQIERNFHMYNADKKIKSYNLIDLSTVPYKSDLSQNFEFDLKFLKFKSKDLMETPMYS